MIRKPTTLNTASCNPTLQLSGAAITRAVILDGLTVAGPSGCTVTSKAVDLQPAATGGPSASPTLSNCRLLAGSGSVAGAYASGSAALTIAQGCAPEITDCDIFGGKGNATRHSPRA